MAPTNRGVNNVPNHQRAPRAAIPSAYATSTAPSSNPPASSSLSQNTHIVGPSINDSQTSSASSSRHPSVTIPYSSAGSLQVNNPSRDQSLGTNLFNINYNPALLDSPLSPGNSPPFALGQHPNSIGFGSRHESSLVGTLGGQAPQAYFSDHNSSLGPLFNSVSPSLNLSTDMFSGHSINGNGYSHPDPSRHYTHSYGDQHHSMNDSFLVPHSGDSLSIQGSIGTLGPQSGYYMFPNDAGLKGPSSSLSTSGSDQESMEIDPFNYSFTSSDVDVALSRVASPQNLEDADLTGADGDGDCEPYIPIPALGNSNIKTSSDEKNSSHGRQLSTSTTTSSAAKEKEQNKQKLYRNRKTEFTARMRDELLQMNLLPSSRITHAPEIMSKTADTLRDYRELLMLLREHVEGMPESLSQVPGAVRKLLSENRFVLVQPQPRAPSSLMPSSTKLSSSTPTPTVSVNVVAPHTHSHSSYGSDLKIMPGHPQSYGAPPLRSHAAQRTF